MLEGETDVVGEAEALRDGSGLGGVPGDGSVRVVRIAGGPTWNEFDSPATMCTGHRANPVRLIVTSWPEGSNRIELV